MNEVSGEFDIRIVPVDTGDDKIGRDNCISP